MTAPKGLQTLRQRLLFFLLLPLAALLLISLVTDYQIAFRPATEAFDHALIDDAIALSGRIRASADKIDIDLPPAAEAVLRSDGTDHEYFSVRGPHNKLLAGDSDLLPDADAAGSQPILSNGYLRGQRIRKATYVFNTPAGDITITAAETMHKREATGTRILLAMILPNVLLILATLALVYIGVRSGLAPLTQLSDEISRRQPHDLSPLPKHDVPAETQPLIKAMDGLIDDLRASTAAQQAFLANAAHQLKTPLAGLQMQLDLAVREIPEQYTRRIIHLRDGADRLAHLTHQLLALARSSSEANLTFEKRRTDLGQLLADSASAWFDLALARKIDLGFDANPAVIQGSEWLLREMLSNLIDNALRYTHPGGNVTARSGQDGNGQPFVEVEDDGPGIQPEDREKIFERFYRPESSPGTGTGLGLAIVKEVAERHAARISFPEADHRGGLRIRITFPSAS